jgi:hypothetical protein
LDCDADKNVTLRGYLASKLDCAPMRITKKYSGTACLGKRAYHFKEQAINKEEVEVAMLEIHALEDAFKQKLIEASKKRDREQDIPQPLLECMTVSTPAIDALVKRCRLESAADGALRQQSKPLATTFVATPCPSVDQSLPCMMPELSLQQQLQFIFWRNQIPHVNPSCVHGLQPISLCEQ